MIKNLVRCIPLLSLPFLAMLSPAPLVAQEIRESESLASATAQSTSRVFPSGVRTPITADRLGGESLGGRGPTMPQVALGTLAGGAAGALFLAGTGYLVGDPHGEVISERQLLAAVGVTIGYPLGAAVGARLSARSGDHGPGLLPVYLVSIAGAALGTLVWSVVESGAPGFYTGAAAGVATHVAVTSLGAIHLGRRASRASVVR